MLNVPPNTMVPIEGHQGLVRDMSSMAIINTDRNSFTKRKAIKKHIMKEKEDLNRANQEIQNLRRDMEELKQQFKSILINKVEEKAKGILNGTTTVPNT